MIVFIDDEPDRIEPWIARTRQELGTDPLVLPSADKAQAWICRSAGLEIDLLVCDLMLPPTTQMDARRTEFGTRTGLLLVEEFRAIHPAVSVLILTNVLDDALVQRIQDPWIRVARKAEMLPSRFVEAARELVEKTRRSRAARSH